MGEIFLVAGDLEAERIFLIWNWLQVYLVEAVFARPLCERYWFIKDDAEAFGATKTFAFRWDF